MDFQTKLAFIYNSNRLDGIQVGEEDTARVLRGDVDPLATADLAGRDGQTYPVAVVASHANALQLAERTGRAGGLVHGEATVRELHRRLMDGVILSNGEYRECILKNKGMPPVPPQQIPDRMKALVHFISDGLAKAPRKDEFAWRVHHEFILIHPFIAGNGRTARLLLNLVRFAGGLDLEVVYHADQPFYLKGIADYLQAKLRLAPGRGAAHLS